MELISGPRDVFLHTERCKSAYDAALSRLPGVGDTEKNTLRGVICTNYVVFETGINIEKLKWLFSRVLSQFNLGGPGQLDIWFQAFLKAIQVTDPHEIHACIQHAYIILSKARNILTSSDLCDALDTRKYAELVRLRSLQKDIKKPVDILSIPDSSHVCTDCHAAGRPHRKTYVKAQLQIRSPDEPMTTYCGCYICGGEWNF